MMKKAKLPQFSAEQSAEALVKTIQIPPRPSLLSEVQQELAAPEPEPRRLARIVANDVALAASLLKLANSSFFGLRLQVTSIDHVVDLLGLQQCSLLLTGIIARQSIKLDGLGMEDFWDISGKRAQAMCYLARQTQLCPLEIAHVFGLFCDIGIPLMMAKFSGYKTVLKQAEQDAEHRFTALEDTRFQTNHAAVGALLARTWGLPADISNAILLHHDYATVTQIGCDDSIKTLVALSLVAEAAIQSYRGNVNCAEWQKGGEVVSRYLALSHHELSDHIETLHQEFDQLH